MRNLHHLAATIFEEFVPPTTTTYTNSPLNPLLGGAGSIALHAFVDNVVAAGTLDIFLEESADDRLFVQRNSLVLGTTAASTTGDLSFTVATGGTYQLVWADPCDAPTNQVVYTGGATSPRDLTGTPLLPFVRLRIVSGSAGCRVKIIASLRGSR
jgi:hypothetical protein